VNKPFGEAFQALFTSEVGKDATATFEALFTNPLIGETRAREVLGCMNEMFYIGIIDNRSSPQCQLSNYILLAVSVLIVLVFGMRINGLGYSGKVFGGAAVWQKELSGRT
jgi:hypothetical protein